MRLKELEKLVISYGKPLAKHKVQNTCLKASLTYTPLIIIGHHMYLGKKWVGHGDYPTMAENVTGS